MSIFAALVAPELNAAQAILDHLAASFQTGAPAVIDEGAMIGLDLLLDLVPSNLRPEASVVATSLLKGAEPGAYRAIAPVIAKAFGYAEARLNAIAKSSGVQLQPAPGETAVVAPAPQLTQPVAPPPPTPLI